MTYYFIGVKVKLMKKNSPLTLMTLKYITSANSRYACMPRMKKIGLQYIKNECITFALAGSIKYHAYHCSKYVLFSSCYTAIQLYSHWNYMYIRQNAMNHLYVLSQKLQYSATSLFTEQKISSAIMPEQPIQRAFQPSWVSKDVFWYLLQIHCHQFQVPRKGRPSHSALDQ